MESPVTLEQLIEYFEREEWNIWPDEENDAIHTGFQGKHAAYTVIVDLQAGKEALLFMVPAYLVVPPQHENRNEVLACLMSLNYEMLLGNFEWDPTDGEVRLRVSVPLDNAELSFEQFAHCMAAVGVAADRYYPALQRVLWAGIPAEQALMELADLEDEEELDEIDEDDLIEI